MNTCVVKNLLSPSRCFEVKETYVRYGPLIYDNYPAPTLFNNMNHRTDIKHHIMTLELAYDSNSSSLAPSEKLGNKSSMDEAQPPAHTAASFSSDDSGNTMDTTHTKASATHVRLCPHHTLSFAQLHQVATTPLLEEGRSLDILVKLFRPHVYELKDTIEPPLSSQLYFRNSACFEPGFELSASWEAVCSRSKYGDYSKEDMRHLLERSNVWLCPHTKLCNNWVVNAILRILKDNDGGRTNKGLEGVRNHCKRCDTDVQVRCLTERPLQEFEARLQIKTKRQLGKGLREDDEAWLKQCVLIADGKGSGSEIDGQREFRCGVQYIRGMKHPST